MNRRDFIRYLLATPIAATLDVEKLLWIPAPLVVVPDIEIYTPSMNIGQIVAEAWEAQIGNTLRDNPLNLHWMMDRLK